MLRTIGSARPDWIPDIAYGDSGMTMDWAAYRSAASFSSALSGFRSAGISA